VLAFSAEVGVRPLLLESVMRVDWPPAIAEAVASGEVLVAGRAALPQPTGVEYAFGDPAEAVAFCWPKGLLARQAAQDSQPDNVIPLTTKPIKAIPGFVPIGFYFLHG
jgi:hypothetical protein